MRAVLAGAVMLAGLGFSAPAMAASGVPAAPSVSIGPYNILETGDTLQHVGSDTLNAGDQVLSKPAPGRSMFWNPITTYFSDSAGYWKFTNGNFMAANTTCTGVTIKADASSSGTVWALKDIGGGDTLFINRYCDQAASAHDDVAMGLALGSGNNTQWKIFGPTACGCWRRLTFVAA